MVSWDPTTSKQTSITTLQLKQWLVDLKEHGQNVCARVRIIGQLWQQHFMRVVNVTEERVLLHDEVNSKLISFQINDIIQMEIDHRFRQFEPHNHYTIVQDLSGAVMRQTESSF